MTKEDIGKINTLTSNWLYHEQEIMRGSDRGYHLKEQAKNMKLLMEIMENAVKEGSVK
jgi:hypothetical protein